MPLTRPIPPEAWPVVLVLRRDVPRPEPESFEPIPPAGVVEDPDDYVWSHLRCAGRCPMGMLPGATSALPIDPENLPGYTLSEEAIDHYLCWFDDQIDPFAAVSATWDWPQGSTGPA